MTLPGNILGDKQVENEREKILEEEEEIAMETIQEESDSKPLFDEPSSPDRGEVTNDLDTGHYHGTCAEMHSNQDHITEKDIRQHSLILPGNHNNSQSSIKTYHENIQKTCTIHGLHSNSHLSTTSHHNNIHDHSNSEHSTGSHHSNMHDHSNSEHSSGSHHNNIHDHSNNIPSYHDNSATNLGHNISIIITEHNSNYDQIESADLSHNLTHKQQYENPGYISDENEEKQKTSVQGNVSFVVDDVDDEKKKKEKTREGNRREDLISALTSVLSILYGGMLMLLGLALPVTEALRSEWMTTTVVGIFNVYIYVVSTIFLIYMIIHVWWTTKNKGNKGNDKDKDKSADKTDDNSSSSKNQRTNDDRGLLMLTVLKPSISGFSTPGYGDDNESPFASYENIHVPNKLSGRALPDQQMAELRRSASLVVNRSRHTSVSSNISLSDDNTNHTGMTLHRRKTSTISAADNTTSVSSVNPMTDEVFEEVIMLHQTASLGHEGASFYLRLGALIFGMANFIYVVLQIEEHYNQAKADCYDLPEVYPMYCHLIFLVVQTFYIFKNTKVHIKKQKAVARFGFIHVLATNMCNWLRILVFEVMEGIYKTKKSLMKENKTDHKHDNATSCLHLDGLYYSMAPYLFPLVLEYSLIAAATMAGMYQSLNIKITKDILQSVMKAVYQKRVVPDPLQRALSQEHEEFFVKSHRGMYGGAILLAGALVAVILFHFTLSGHYNKHDEVKALQIYYCTDLILHVILIPPVLYCTVKFSKFKFTYNRENTIDDTLLLAGLGGLVLYHMFVIFTTASGDLFNIEEEDIEIATYLSLANAVINILQAVLQGVFVIAGLQLCAANRQQAKDKPGRGALTFMIIGNITLWFFKTFLVKEVSLHKFVDFFGMTAWPIIMNINLPLVLFYRFHVSVCLADMWASVYKPETGPKYKMLQ